MGSLWSADNRGMVKGLYGKNVKLLCSPGGEIGVSKGATD